MKICKFLRWKGHNSQQNAEIVRRVFLGNHVQYSCLRTMQVWSPKGEFVAPEGCNVGRSCYECKKLPDTGKGSPDGRA